MSRLPPILYHVFRTPLPYRPTLALQQNIQDIQRARRKEGIDYPDLLLLLEHRPTYTGGRRQNAQDLSTEETRLKGLGAEWVPTYRGGETTFHGPGQIVGYPLMDLSHTKVSSGLTDDCLIRSWLTLAPPDEWGRHILLHTSRA